jgi:hypothetical protein
VTRRSSGRARSSVRDPRGEERARSCHLNPVESSRISIPRSEQFTRMMWKLLNALSQPAATILRGMAADIRQRGPAASDASSQLRHGATVTTGPISRQARTSTQRKLDFQPPGTTRKLPLAPGVPSPPLLPDPRRGADKLPCHRCDAARRGSRCQAARFRADSREHGRRPAFREQERRDARAPNPHSGRPRARCAVRPPLGAVVRCACGSSGAAACGAGGLMAWERGA